mmetsp:Transcript_20730/g.26829  ORF Transcript_20730/g.26829 Transcript_20730/m.26829 type:complete len:104 (-) Transcript_20730:45-356(-)|eukprot:CAMPEP_0197349662 /NCGR_PEP_ID=MMETSP0893-20130614/11387_1 /TAXON_ID=44058 ORGANISM="Aureoumbra lagunensis, Strain CCMP1510" /NCGR_SAMPLE_ID=MMETSP0893 /ASSEMBLY_ACC=CAM_ASM_000539 /LENGTH=103 /DNA_ID=CAMNT_0042861153 /DNA_START=41 /DNA_END=352 /DNA_ORIENTATION=-
MKVTILTLLMPLTVALCPGRRDFIKISAGAASVAVTTPAFATYTGKPTEEAPKTEAKAKWNTLYPEKKLTLEKKSPVDRLDLAPPTFQTYKKTYPGLTEAFGN